jgi:hypothetical protein
MGEGQSCSISARTSSYCSSNGSKKEIARQLAKIEEKLRSVDPFDGEIVRRLDLIDRRVTHFWDKKMMVTASGYAVAVSYVVYLETGETGWKVAIAGGLAVGVSYWLLSYGFPTSRK